MGGKTVRLWDYAFAGEHWSRGKIRSIGDESAVRRSREGWLFHQPARPANSTFSRSRGQQRSRRSDHALCGRFEPAALRHLRAATALAAEPAEQRLQYAGGVHGGHVR